ncbi:neuromedin-U receptor 2-like [Amphiura filiformis]|uniref:neuromedin-U receptor 2-like n=1 Tax=Amphiura filiformis TaxID=82378 RepID=UPI003B20D0F9
METTLAYTKEDFPDNSTYEHFMTDPNGTDEADLPFEIPNCPAGTILQILYYFPDEAVENLFYTPIEKFLISYVFPIVIAIGFTTNLAFLWTLVRVRDMRTTTNFYLANLACADLILILLKTVATYFNRSSDLAVGGPWKSVSACASRTIALYIGYFASISLVTLVSIERFLAICFPFKHRMINDKAHTIKMVSGAWLLAIIFAALVTPNWSGELARYCVVWPEKYQNRLPTVINICGPVTAGWPIVATICEFVPYIVAICLSTVLYALIIHRLSQRDDISEGGEKTGNQNQATKTRNAVARMLVLNGIIFFLCLSPYQFVQIYYFIANLTDIYYFDNNNIQIVLLVGRILDLVNSSVNPIIYSATNARYRKAFFTAFNCGSTTTNKGGTTLKTVSSST